MNLTGILSELYRFFHYTTTPPAATTARITAYVNDTQREILTMPELQRLRDDVMAITAKANTARTGLPPSVQRIIGVTDRAHNRKLRQSTIAELRLMDPAQTFISGFPIRYAPASYAQVQYQPAAATGLWAVSSAAGDTTQTVYIESITTGGYSYKDTKALNGTTRVQIGATATRTDHERVERFYIGALAVGYISLYDAAAAGNELARIEPGKSFARYLTVEWHPVQTADTTLYMDFTRTVFDLVNAFDEPLLPDDFHNVVVDGSAAKECLFSSDGRYSAAMADYRIGIDKLKSFVMNDGDRITSLRPVRLRWSSVGSMFPDEQWPS